MLVGGLMVHLHAHLAGVRHQRPTNDVDVVVLPGSISYAEVAATLNRLGYRPRPVRMCRSERRQPVEVHAGERESYAWGTGEPVSLVVGATYGATESRPWSVESAS